MSTNDAPRGRERVIVAALIAGQTYRDTADRAGCSVATVTRVRAKWKAYITAGREEVAEQAAAQLLAMVPRAAAALNQLIDSPLPAVRLSAVRYVLDGALRWRDTVEFERELRALEADRDQPPAAEQWQPWAGKIDVDAAS